MNTVVQNCVEQKRCFPLDLDESSAPANIIMHICIHRVTGTRMIHYRGLCHRISHVMAHTCECRHITHATDSGGDTHDVPPKEKQLCTRNAKVNRVKPKITFSLIRIFTQNIKIKHPCNVFFPKSSSSARTHTHTYALIDICGAAERVRHISCQKMNAGSSLRLYVHARPVIQNSGR